MEIFRIATVLKMKMYHLSLAIFYFYLWTFPTKISEMHQSGVCPLPFLFYIKIIILFFFFCFLSGSAQKPLGGMGWGSHLCGKGLWAMLVHLQWGGCHPRRVAYGRVGHGPVWGEVGSLVWVSEPERDEMGGLGGMGCDSIPHPECSSPGRVRRVP